jgi:hypothetical protein
VLRGTRAAKQLCSETRFMRTVVTVTVLFLFLFVALPTGNSFRFRKQPFHTSHTSSTTAINMAHEMKTLAVNATPFSESELDRVILSLQQVAPDNNTMDWQALRELVAQSCHLTHKDWQRTEAAAQVRLEL